MTRQPMPNCRRCETVETRWQTSDAIHPFTVTIGFDDAGQPKEVFAGHAKGALLALISDACIVISVALQSGVTPDELAKSMGTVPAWVNGEKGDAPASPLGAIVAAIREAEA